MSAAGQRGTLAPLPPDHRLGLIILTAFSFLSFMSTAVLWLFITYKLLVYRKRRRAERKKQKQRRQNAAPTNPPTAAFPDLSLGLENPSGNTGFDRILELDRLAEEQRQQERDQPPPAEATQETEEEEEEKNRNPFPILVYNLLLADMMEALAYGLSAYWVTVDGIFAPSPVCWAQGWLGSTSNLAASLFLSVIAINTFLTVGLGYKVPPWAVYAAIAGLWIFDFGVNGAGVRFSDQQPLPGESFFMRANVWCWMSSAYDSWRLWAHYFWVMVSIGLTISLYSFVFFTLWRQKRSCRYLPERKRSRNGGTSAPNSPQPEPRQLSGYHPAFLAYPFVYIGCSTPLVIGRVTSLLGKDLGIPYFAFAGSVLAANGLFNSILWTTTIIFSAPQDVHDTGLDRFAFIRTPIREYGHTVVISGPASRRVPLSEVGSGNGRKEWWWWRYGGQRGWGKSFTNRHELPIVHQVQVPTLATQSSVEGPYIQMDVVTAVMSEPVESSASAK